MAKNRTQTSVYYLIFAFLLGASSFARADDLDLSWTHETPWKKLLHYRSATFGVERSTIDSGDFFFAKDGATNPEAEAVAFMKALKANQIVGKLKQTVFCSFPERTRFILEKTKVFLSDEVRRQKCDLYDNYIQQFNDPQKISLVFSSAYPNNPASMFGHTFLKVHSKRQTDLIDVGLNYAAAVSSDENPFAFFWFGVTGGYAGRWSIEPYYVKVQDYVNFESRDLWEYEISFTPSEVRRFLDHVWEIENNSFSGYYFFDENCSYQILSTIEAIRPEWNLLNYKIYVIPGESVKFLMTEPTAVREVRFRPSLIKKADLSYQALDPNEKKNYNLVLNSKDLEGLKRLSTQALDTLLIEMDLKRNQDKKFEANWIPFQNAIRNERALRGVNGTKSGFDQAGSGSTITRPDYGHDSYDLQSGLGLKNIKNGDSAKSESRSFISFKIKSAYHDLLNSDQGYSQFSEIDFPWLTFTVDSKNKFKLQELGGIETISLSPVSHFKTPISFKAKVALQNYDDYDQDFFYLNGDFGFGFSTNALEDQSRLYSLATISSEVAPDFSKGYRILPGIEFGYLATVANNYKVQFLAAIKCNVVDAANCSIENRYEINQSIFLARNHELRNTNSYRQFKSPNIFQTRREESIFSFHYLFFFN